MLKKIKIILITISLLLIIGNLSPVAIADPGNTIYVDDDADPSWYDATHVKTIQEGINNASSGDTVFVYNGIYYEHLLINDKIIDLIGENKNTTIIDCDGVGTGINVTYVNYPTYYQEITISNFTVKNSQIGYTGISVNRSNYVIITNCIFQYNTYGVDYHYASKNTLTGNIMKNNKDGICLYKSTNNTIRSNNINNNTEFGIYLHDNSSYNNINNNTIEYNLLLGAYIQYSDENNLINNIFNSNLYGIELSSSQNNHIYHNNFKESFVTNALDDFSNIWDNGYPSGGNYWSDYTGEDIYSGPGQNEPGADYIGDTPYYIPGGSNQDNYPLLNRPPNFPSDPSPLDGSTNMALNLILSWQCSDPDWFDNLYYDVYLEKNDPTPDEIVSYYQTETTYTTETLDFNTTYYWKIKAIDNNGAYTNGPIWNFTTKENSPPYVPSNPNPSNESINVLINKVLSWTGGDPDGQTVKYDVYFGNVTPPLLVVSNQTGTTYNPGTMSYNTTFYWQIIAWDNKNANAQGPIWQFTTIPQPNQPPYEPSNPNPADGATDVVINKVLSWTGGDPEGNTVYYDVYFDAENPNPTTVVSNNQVATSYNPGSLLYNTTYYWKIVAEDSFGEITEGLIWNFKTIENFPPNVPINPNPDNGLTKVPIDKVLSWTGGDPYGDPVTYDVYFGTNSSPAKIVSNQSAASYDPPGSLSYSTTYYWMIVSWDSYGEFSNGTIWSFTTAAKSSGGGSSGGGGGAPPGPVNIPPKANANGPYYEIIGVPIVFNGSGSTDSDGKIDTYKWDFGDGNVGLGINTYHTYLVPGNYTVKLTVTDNLGLTNTITTFALISDIPNSPPNKPSISGTISGNKNIDYNYTAVSTDVNEDDTIKYEFDWGDETFTTSDYFESDVNCSVMHNWSNAGIYKIKVSSVDEHDSISESSELVVLIDCYYCAELGYLIDENSDGTYDSFYSNQTGNITSTKKQNDGSYLINDDEDSGWDYTYNLQTGTINVYIKSKASGPGNAIYALPIAVIIAFLLISSIIIIRRNNKVIATKNGVKTQKKNGKRK